MRLFLVDDDSLVARTIGDCLRLSGFDLVGDASSLDAIHGKLSDGQVDLLLLDLKLSQTTRCPDFTFIRDLRDRHQGLKVVPLTGLRGGHLVHLAMVNGVAGYAIKGCVPDELVWVVQPWWVKAVRIGNILKTYKSTNGTTWVQVGSDKTITMTNPVQVGLVVTSGKVDAACLATIDNVTITTP